MLHKFNSIKIILFIAAIASNNALESRVQASVSAQPQMDIVYEIVQGQRHNRKRWTFYVYMAADNDLYPFADRNIEQLKQIGSNENVNILVHLDMHRPGSKKITRRLFIQKNKAVQIGPDLSLDSGDEQTLIDDLKWVEDEFPSDYLAVDFWNHGSGDLNPVIGRTINPSQLFVYNSETKLIELDRSIGFLEFIDSMLKEHRECRGVCFDETTGNYLNDQKLKRGLEVSCKYRGNRKIDVILFDACLMAGTGTAWTVHPYAKYMTASEEVVLGTGYEYDQIVVALTKNNTTPQEFALHIVKCYANSYSKVTNDYTQSAINLENYEKLANNIDLLATLLIKALQHQKNNSVKEALKKSSSKLACTHFDEPSYKDFRHWCRNLQKSLSSMTFNDSVNAQELVSAIKQTLNDSMAIINEVVIANAAGPNLREAGGISIYFPERKIHPSFVATEFGINNTWSKFLTYYLSLPN